MCRSSQRRLVPSAGLPTPKLIDVKLKSSRGVRREDLVAMRKKIIAAEKLATVMQASREQKERLVDTEVVPEASELVNKAEAEGMKTGEADLPSWRESNPSLRPRILHRLTPRRQRLLSRRRRLRQRTHTWPRSRPRLGMILSDHPTVVPRRR